MYTPVVGNPVGDEAFRCDRADWYERITGEHIHELDLQEQQALCDVVARRFRAYGDWASDRSVCTMLLSLRHITRLRPCQCLHLAPQQLNQQRQQCPPLAATPPL